MTNREERLRERIDTLRDEREEARDHAAMLVAIARKLRGERDRLLDEVVRLKRELASATRPKVLPTPKPTSVDGRRVAVHGTQSKYILGCRCPSCTAANAEYQRIRKARAG